MRIRQFRFPLQVLPRPQIIRRTILLMVFTDPNKVGGVDIIVIRPSQDMLNFKAWGDHIQSDHLTILVLVYCWVSWYPPDTVL